MPLWRKILAVAISVALAMIYFYVMYTKWQLPYFSWIMLPTGMSFMLALAGGIWTGILTFRFRILGVVLAVVWIVMILVLTSGALCITHLFDFLMGLIVFYIIVKRQLRKAAQHATP